jgi:hypothetical protein
MLFSSTIDSRTSLTWSVPVLKIADIQFSGVEPDASSASTGVFGSSEYGRDLLAAYPSIRDTALNPVTADAPGKLGPVATNSNSAVLPGDAGPKGTTALDANHSQRSYG